MHHVLGALALMLLGLVAPGLGRADAEPTRSVPHGATSRAFPSHHFQWAPHSVDHLQLAMNFGLVQLALGGINVSAELRYRRLWLTYQHGAHLTLNNLSAIGLGRLALSPAERADDLHVFLPYSTGFGLGVLLLDELWLGTEFTASRLEARAPGGPTASYETYSVGLVLGYRFFVWRALHLNAYVRYWPTLASSLDHDRVTLSSPLGPVQHRAHDFGVYPNLALGYAFDL